MLNNEDESVGPYLTYGMKLKGDRRECALVCFSEDVEGINNVLMDVSTAMR